MGKPTRVWTGTEWVSIAPATVPGRNAYELAVLNGFEGSLDDWLESLIGPAGSPGPPGPPGTALAGLPAGGTLGQILGKLSDDDYDVGWVDAPAGGGAPVDIIAQTPYPTGGTVTTYTDGVTGYDYRVHTFYYTGSPDSLVVTNGVIGHLLMVGGGGAGGGGRVILAMGVGGGGGGAGAYFNAPYAFGAGTHALFVGAGGAADTNVSAVGRKGGDTLFEGYPGTITGSTYIAYGGGGGGKASDAGDPAGNGGSAGGAGGARGGTSYDGTATYGSKNGGVSTDSTSFIGAGAGASNSSTTPHAGLGPNAGAGQASDITGSSVTYAKGGALDGGAAPVANTGSGGRGAAAGSGTLGENGANGLVIVRYRVS